MEFAWTEEQNDVRELARRILSEKVDDSAQKAREKAGQTYLPAAWEALSEAELLQLVISEKNGGAGMGAQELGILLREAGRVAAPIPLLGTLVLAALPLDRHGSPAQAKLVAQALGAKPAVAGAWFEIASRDLSQPKATLTREGGRLVLNAVKTNVEAADAAEAFVVNAQLEGQPAIVIVRKNAAGVSLADQMGTNIVPLSELTCAGVEIAEEDVVATGDKAREIIAETENWALFAQSALMLGLGDGAVALISDYAPKRVQFGQPIAQFQAVGQRSADAWINLQAMEMLVLKAAFELDNGSDAATAVRKAKYWASEGGHHIVAAASHIHGGMGFDRDYPLHRYFLSMKLNEFTLGGANAQLQAVGRAIANGVKA